MYVGENVCLCVCLSEYPIRAIGKWKEYTNLKRPSKLFSMHFNCAISCSFPFLPPPSFASALRQISFYCLPWEYVGILWNWIGSLSRYSVFCVCAVDRHRHLILSIEMKFAIILFVFAHVRDSLNTIWIKMDLQVVDVKTFVSLLFALLSCYLYASLVLFAIQFKYSNGKWKCVWNN